jgi:hypothetical protein
MPNIGLGVQQVFWQAAFKVNLAHLILKMISPCDIG